MIKVAVVNRFTLHREGLLGLLREHEDLEVIGEAEDGYGAVELVRRGRPDVVLLEVMLPRKDGIEAAKEIVGLGVRTKVLAMAAYGTVHLALRILRAGAQGFIHWNSRTAELVSAIKLVHSGKTYLPPELQHVFAERYFRLGAGQSLEELLSDREFQVARLIASGYSNREIANQLYISIKTVDTHRANLLRKLLLRNNADITRFAIQHGLIQSDLMAAAPPSIPE
jgi:DNA-binding NarL/FixJ family response regulator